MKIHQDGAVATPSRKAVSFRDVESFRHSGRTPLRENNGRTPTKSPFSNSNSTRKSTLFKSPSSTKTTKTSNSFRQDLKKGCTPSSTKTKTRRQIATEHEKENYAHEPQRNRQHQYQSNQKPTPTTPSSASALRRTLRSTIQPQETQQQSKKSLHQNTRGSFKLSSNSASDNGPFQSVATAMSYSSSYSTSSLVGRSRLLGKGGLAPGKSMKSSLGPPTRVAPKTPNTLLRTELEDEDEFDESFLLSPPPGALWNALNLSSGGGNNAHTISPNVTTGLIVVSPQAAEQIHTWSSSKKQLSSTNSSAKATDDRVSPTVPRALMQTPNSVATTKHLAPTTHSYQNSDRRNTTKDPETEKEQIKATSMGENLHLVEGEKLVVAADIQNANTEMEGASESNVLKSIQKSTKGGIAMDMTGFFCLEDSEPQKKHEKKWVESEPLSSSMPAALLSRLSANRPLSSKKIKNKETKPSLMESNGSSSKARPVDEEIKSPVRRSTTTTKVNKFATKSAISNRVKKKSIIVEETASSDTLEESKNQGAESTIRAKNKISVNPEKEKDSKPWRRPLTKQNTLVHKNVESSIKGQKTATNSVPKPWKKNKVTKENTLAQKNKKSSFASHNAATKDEIKPWKKQIPKRTQNSNGAEQVESKATGNYPEKEENSKTESKHRGGLAFEVSFNDVDNAKMPLKNSTNRIRTMKTSSIKIKTKEPSNSHSWADKQCEVFVGWLNYTLNPEEMDITSDGCVASGLRALIIHRRLAEGRVNALNLFKGDSMLRMRTIIAKEITRGRLSIRSDRDVSVDVHLRKKLTSLLLSYTTPWLRVALEVMSGEYIDPVPISENGPKTYLGRMKLALEHFIKRRFLSDENTLQKFTKGRCSMPSGVFETRYKEEMRNLVLSRIMILVFFLDRAKASNVLENVPRLFTVSSNVKSTRDVLVTICRECLSSEGDIVKHLSRIGLKISYIQDPIDEVNFRVTNLATDLRDGVILTRLSEIVTAKQFKSSMSSLRLPAVSRLQKKFNMNLALSAIKDFGIVVAEGINAHHIMDGHREMVLALMWCIIAHCCLGKLLQGDQVEQEIQNVIQSSLARKKLEDRSSAQVEKVLLKSPITSIKGKTFSADEILKDLLLRWSQAVCSSFGVTINNLSESFADGKALCLLVHYYHPSLIHMDEIFPKFDINSEEEVLAAERLNWKKASKSMQELGGIPDMLPICDSQNPPNEKSMLLCLSYLCSRLMESSREIFATILIQACYQKYRRKVLMEKKIAAAASIFRIWTLYKENYFQQQQKRFKISVATLENFILSHKHSLKRMKKERLKNERLIHSVTNIQRVFRGKLGRARSRRLRGQRMGAIIIQRNFRRYLAMRIAKKLIHQRDSAVVIQSAFRRYIAQEIFLDYRYYIIELQRNLRGYLARKELKAKDHAALVIQQAWLSHMVHTEMEIAAILLQKTWRGVLGRRKWIQNATRRDAASAIQKVWRGYYQVKVYSIALHSSITMQKMIRGFLGRKAVSVNRYRNAATSIQKIWRGFSLQVKYQMDIFDIVCVQSMVRRYLSKRRYEAKTKALSIIQCAIRCSIARRELNVKIRERMEERLRFQSAVIIQAHVRSLIARQNIVVLHCSAFVIQNQWRRVVHDRLRKFACTKIQSMYRSRKCKSMFLRSKTAAIDLQRCWRGFASRQNDKVLSFAATLIQCTWRRYWVYSDYTLYMKETKSATLIQAHVRRMATMRMIDMQNSLARTIQCQWLKYQRYKLERNSATKIQSFFRSHRSRSQYLDMKSASIVLQQMARAHQARKVLHVKQRQRQYERSAITVQRIWRGFWTQVLFQMDMMDIVSVQSIARRYLVSRAHKRNVLASSVIQRAFRCAAARREKTLRSEHRRNVLASSVIQRAFRCAAARRERALRKLVLDTMVTESSLKIQAAVRGFISRSKFLMMKSSLISIQKSWRGYDTRKYIGWLSQNATVIQSNWRMYQLRKNYMSFLVSATKIQTCFRLHSTQSKYFGMKKAAVCIQRHWRGNASRDHLSKQHQACTMIQSHWRRSYAQNNFLLDLLEIKSATLIQATFRMYMNRMDYMVIKYSAHTIQRFTRGLLSRVDLAVKHFAATEIQRIWRGHCISSSESMILCVIKIQSVMRMTFAKKKADTLRILNWAENCNRNRNACVIQTSFRKYMLQKKRERAAIIIQNNYRFRSELKRVKAASRGVIELQSRFRGAHVRKKRSKKLRQLAHQIQEETRRAVLNPTLRLGYRTSRALEILQTSQSLTKIMDAVKELEASTRLSVVCCQVFTKVNAANILLYLIQSCNRSVPHMELKEHILLTLENVAQYPSLVGSFAHYKYAEVFLDNVQVFRDKDGIFCLAVLLLGRITKADKDVAQFCATHEHLKRLKEVYRVVSRRSRRTKVKKNIVLSAKTRRLRECGLAKRDDFDRAASTRLLKEMIDAFSEIEVPHIMPTPNAQLKKFDWNELQYSPLI